MTQRPNAVLFATCSGYFMVILDATVVNLALPSLGRSLHTTTTGLEWVVDSYTLVFAALLLAAGALSDRQGARRVFLAGVAVFSLASAGCGLAPSTAALVGARVVQGIGAALAVPASLALLQAAYPDQASRRRAFGVWGGVAGIGAGAGPIFGGALVSALGWRSIFFLNLPIAALGLVLGARVLPDTGRRPRRLDGPGQLSGTVALATLTAGFIEAGRRGWTSPVVVACAAVFVVAAVAFVEVERRGEEPMLPAELFSRPAFSAPTAVGLLINLGFYGELFVLSLYLQDVRHLGVLIAGVALLPQMATVVVGSVSSGRAMAHRGPRRPMLVGLLTGAAGLAGLAVTTGSRTPYWWMVLPFVATGFGMAFTMPAATAAIMEAAPAERGGLASGTLNSARQVGGALGVAVLGSLVASRSGLSGGGPGGPGGPGGGPGGPGGFIGGLHAGLFVAAGSFALAALLTAAGVGRHPNRSRSRPSSRLPSLVAHR